MFFLTFNSLANFWQTLGGPLSAVSTPNFASEYSFESSWRDLQDLHTFYTLGLQSENQEKRFWQASSGRSSRPRRRNHQAAAKQRGREECRKECAPLPCSETQQLIVKKFTRFSQHPKKTSRTLEIFVAIYAETWPTLSEFHRFFHIFHIP